MYRTDGHSPDSPRKEPIISRGSFVGDPKRAKRQDRRDDRGEVALRLPDDTVAAPKFWALYRAVLVIVAAALLGLLLALVSWPLGLALFGVGAIAAPTIEIVSLQLGGLGRLQHSDDRSSPIPRASRPARAGLRPSSRAK